ncbi:unnamed protein product [Camellia sinensis]
MGRGLTVILFSVCPLLRFDTISTEVTEKEAFTKEVMGTRELEERVDDHVSISIVEKFANLSNPSSECCIFRMYDHLRKENEKAYEPSIVAIGPYHHGKAHLQEMELHKLRYLRRFLSRRNETSVNRYVMAIRELEDRARKCYAEETSILGLGVDSDQFVEMMLLDGFFIIELFRTYTMFIMLRENQQIFQSVQSVEELRDENYRIFQAFQIVQLLLAENDHIFKSDQILVAIRRDLILLENQLPFFILNRLFDMTNSDSNLGIIQIALDFQKHLTQQNKLQAPSGISIDNIKHLLDLLHNCWCSKLPETNRNVIMREKWEFINSATELQEAGVQFKKAEGSNLFDIKFISGTLEIPLLSITDYTESFFTNLVAFELCPSYLKPKYVCDYIVFMDRLINSSKDVRLLNHSGIIESWVGDDAEVYSMLHKLFNITVTDPGFGYSEVFINVNNHCKQRRNVWMANLKRNYFNSPWALISFLAATILLLLTVTQTIFSILSFGKGSF